MSQLNHFDIEVSRGGQWVSLNDHERYEVTADSLATRAKTFRQVKASSAIVEGDVLVHAVADMVVETVKVKVFGTNQIDLEENLAELEELFEQFAFKVRVTKNNFREIWSCQMSQSLTIETGHVYSHNMMAVLGAQVSRYPKITREGIM